MAVAALIEKGDIKLEELPVDLRREIVKVAAAAQQAMKDRVREEHRAQSPARFVSEFFALVVHVAFPPRWLLFVVGSCTTTAPLLLTSHRDRRWQRGQ